MKILLVNYEYPPVGGGGGVAARNLAEEWVRQGHEVDVLTSAYQDLPKKEVVEGVTIYRSKVLGRDEKDKASMISLLTFPFASTVKGLWLCRKRKYDLINTHFAIPSGPTGWVLSKLFRIKNVLSVHGADIYDPTRNIHNHPIFKRAVKFILNRADVIVAQSKDIQRKAVEFYKPNKEVKRIPLGFIKPSFKPATREKLGLEENKFYLIAVGRVVERKGYNYLIEALPEDKDIELLIVGDGPERKKLEKQAEGKPVKFLGRVEEEEKWQYLSVADLYTLSSLHEGFAIVLQEAMYCGLPIVATNTGGQTDYLKEGENALFVKPKDPEALRWMIQKVRTDLELRKKLSANNKRDIEDHFVEKIAKKYLEL